MYTYIIILNWNGLEDSQECLQSLYASNDFHTTCKIVLLDNGSKENEGTVLQQTFPEIILLQEKTNTGFAQGNNIAINHALEQPDCNNILLLNNDTIVAKSFLHPLLTHLSTHPKSIVSPKILRYHKRDTIESLGDTIFLAGARHLHKNKPSKQYTDTLTVDALTGCCLVATKEAWLDIGLFDATYFAYMEDVDWSLRARNKGYTLAAVGQSSIYHKGSQSTKGSYFKSFYGARNNIYFARKHYRGLKKYMYIKYNIVLSILIHTIRYRDVRFIPHYLKGLREGFSLPITSDT